MSSNQRRWIIEECGEDVEQASLHLTGELVPIRVVAPIAAQPPATAQGLREDAQHITVYCDHRGSTAGTPCKSCSLIAGRLRELADWLETPAPEGRESQFRPGDGGWHIGGRNGLARRQANGMWFYRLNDGTEGYCHYREDAERWIDDQPAPPPAQEGIPTPAPEGRESLELSDNRDAAFAALGEIYKLCGYTLDGMLEQYDPRLFISAVAQRLRTQPASPAQARPRTTRAQVLAAVNRYIVAIWSHETTEHEKAIDELMRDLGIEEVE